MGANIAYGERDAIGRAIQTGSIPTDTVIITKEHDNIGELFFYDADGILKAVSERSRFLSVTEAIAWAKKYDCRGHIYSVQNGDSWKLYLVQDDYTLSAINGSGGTIDVDDIDRIDGGSPAGLL